MSSFGVALLALSIAVAPGVIFIVCFFYSSSIKRTGISFGPTIDLALFFSISLLLNGAYGGGIQWVSGKFSNSCTSSSLNLIIYNIIYLVNGQNIRGCSLSSFVDFAYIYLVSLCIFSGIIGWCIVALIEVFGLGVAHSVFSNFARNERRFGATTCTVLCKFSGTVGKNESFVMYIGDVEEILLSDKHAISSIALKNVSRSVLRIGTKITSLPKHQRTELDVHQLIIPGESVENISMFYVEPVKIWKIISIFFTIIELSIVIIPIIFSVVFYTLNPSNDPISSTDILSIKQNLEKKFELGVDLNFTDRGIDLDCGKPGTRIITFPDEDQTDFTFAPDNGSQQLQKVIQSLAEDYKSTGRPLYGVVLIGSADRKELKFVSKLKDGDNANIARKRVAWVRENLLSLMRNLKPGEIPMGKNGPAFIDINSELPIVRLTPIAHDTDIAKQVAVCALWE